MEDIILIGSGQHCHVVLYNIREQGKYNAVAILDSDIHKKGQNVEGIPIVGTYDIETLDYVKKTYNTNKFFIAFGAMEYRKKVFQYMINCGWDTVNIIHPQAVVSPNTRLGKGVLIECGSLVCPDPVIGDNVVINTGSILNHDNVVENHVFIASGVILSGGVTIRENTLLDDGVTVSLGRTVGSNCIIGAGAVVTKDIPDSVVAFGVPAKVIRKNQ